MYSGTWSVSYFPVPAFPQRDPAARYACSRSIAWTASVTHRIRTVRLCHAEFGTGAIEWADARPQRGGWIMHRRCAWVSDACVGLSLREYGKWVRAFSTKVRTRPDGPVNLANASVCAPTLGPLNVRNRRVNRNTCSVERRSSRCCARHRGGRRRPAWPRSDRHGRTGPPSLLRPPCQGLQLQTICQICLINDARMPHTSPPSRIMRRHLRSALPRDLDFRIVLHDSSSITNGSPACRYYGVHDREPSYEWTVKASSALAETGIPS